MTTAIDISEPVKRPRMLGTAEAAGNAVRFRLSRGADPKRKWLDLRDYIADVIGESMSEIPALAVEQGRRVAHLMSLKVEELRARPVLVAVRGETTDQWFGRWCQNRVAEAEVASDERDRSAYSVHIKPVIGHLQPGAIDRQHIEQIVGNLDDLITLREQQGKPHGCAWKTAENTWWTLVAMCRDMAFSKPHRGLRCRSTNPCTDVARPKRGVDRARTFLYPSEYVTLVTSPALWHGTGRNVLVGRHYRRWARLFTLAIYLVMRAGELRAVRWEHVDLQHRVITVTIAAVPGSAGKLEGSPKNGTVRTFAIPLQLVPLLRHMREEAGGEKASGRLMKLPGEKELAKQLKRYCGLAGLARAALYADTLTQAPLTFHDLRATGITWLARQPSCNPYDIMRMAGHGDLTTTQEYIRDVQALPSEFGEPFPPVPAVVFGDAAVVEPSGNGGSDDGTGPDQSGPTSDHNGANAANWRANRNPPVGPHHAGGEETTVIPMHLGPSDPRHTTDRHRSHAESGPAGDIVVATLAEALAQAIAAGNADAAARFASALAREHTAQVLPLRRGKVA